MTILTKQDINDYCANLNISRENLTEFTIPDDVTRIGCEAFGECSALTSVTIPDSVTHIGEAFSECSSLTQVICNHSELFTYENINIDQIEIISTAAYFKEHYQDLLNTIEDSG